MGLTWLFCRLSWANEANEVAVELNKLELLGFSDLFLDTCWPALFESGMEEPLEAEWVRGGGGNWIGLNVYLFELSSFEYLLADTGGHTVCLFERFDVLFTRIDAFFSSSTLVHILVNDEDDEAFDPAVIISDDIELDWLGDTGAANGENGDEAADLTLFIDLELLYINKNDNWHLINIFKWFDFLPGKN